MSAFYGIDPDDVPAFVGMADSFVAFEDLPDATQVYISAMLEHLRSLHADNPLAFEAVIQFVAAAIDAADDNATDPRDSS
jgi:hypothetical protein